MNRSAVFTAYNRAVWRLPGVERQRKDRALGLVLAGKVDGTAVESPSAPGGHYQLGPQGCACKDARFRAPWVAMRPACKHQLAVWIAARASRVETSWRDELHGVAAQLRAVGRTAGAEIAEKAASATSVEHYKIRIIELEGLLVNHPQFESVFQAAIQHLKEEQK